MSRQEDSKLTHHGRASSLGADIMRKGADSLDNFDNARGQGVLGVLDEDEVRLAVFGKLQGCKQALHTVPSPAAQLSYVIPPHIVVVQHEELVCTAWQRERWYMCKERVQLLTSS